MSSLKDWLPVILAQANQIARPAKMFKDASGIELIELGDLGGTPVQEGDTLARVTERTHHDKWAGSKDRKKMEVSGFGFIEFWVIIDRGEPDNRASKMVFDGNTVTLHGQNSKKITRFTIAPKASGETVSDVEFEYHGMALEGKYLSEDQASSVVEHLNAISDTHEE